MNENADLKEKLRVWFSWNKNTYKELDDDEINELFSPNMRVSFDVFLLKNGFCKEQIFSQICYYYNHIYDCVVTSEYSDNTGQDYWRYFDSAKEYNEHVCIKTEGIR